MAFSMLAGIFTNIMAFNRKPAPQQMFVSEKPQPPLQDSRQSQATSAQQAESSQPTPEEIKAAADARFVADINREHGTSFKTRQEAQTHLDSLKAQASKQDAAAIQNEAASLPEEQIIRENNTLSRAGMHLNGVVEGTIEQSSVNGNCWMMAAIEATPRQILNESITINDNGDALITLQGAGKTYTITKEEIKSRMGTLSKGDLDICAFELALEKYVKENPGIISGKDLDSGGFPSKAMDALVAGKNTHNVFFGLHGLTSNETLVKRIEDNFNNVAPGQQPSQIMTACTGPRSGKKPNMLLNMDGTVAMSRPKNGFSMQQSNHAYTITGVEGDYILLKNPYNTGKTLKIHKDNYKTVFISTQSRQLAPAVLARLNTPDSDVKLANNSGDPNDELT